MLICVIFVKILIQIYATDNTNYNRKYLNFI